MPRDVIEFDPSIGSYEEMLPARIAAAKEKLGAATANLQAAQEAHRQANRELAALSFELIGHSLRFTGDGVECTQDMVDFADEFDDRKEFFENAMVRIQHATTGDYTEDRLTVVGLIDDKEYIVRINHIHEFIPYQADNE